MESVPVPLEIVSGAGETSKGRSIMGGSEITQLAKEQIAQLSGLDPDRVSGLSRDEDGWHVTVDMVELKRVPASTDVLGTYEALIDDQGNLMTYKRIRRYCRSDTTAEL